MGKFAPPNSMLRLASAAGNASLQAHIAHVAELHAGLRELITTAVLPWFDTMPPLAHRAVRNLFEAGGKRLRPVLALLSADIAGGTWQDAMPVAAAVELLHTGTLLHDDIVDAGMVRRGQPAAHTVFGNSVAVLSGDFCFFAALDALLATKDLVLIQRMTEVARQLATGELAQLERRGQLTTSSVGDYFDVIECKTGSLFSFATWGGARVGSGLPAREHLEPGAVVEDALHDYGRHLGVAFQMVDDILDLMADEAEAGKRIGQDVRDGVLTLPLLYALEERPALRQVLAAAVDTINDDAVFELLAAVGTTAAIPRSIAQVKIVVASARDALGPCPEGDSLNALHTVALALVERLGTV